jgi:hypothetical protein
MQPGHKTKISILTMTLATQMSFQVMKRSGTKEFNKKKHMSRSKYDNAGRIY